MDIKQALSQLDPLDDAHWTGDGAPKVDVVSEILGKVVSRKEIVDAAPLFNRENPVDAVQEEGQGPKEVSLLDQLLKAEPMDPAKMAAMAGDLEVEDLQILSRYLEEQRNEAERMVSDAQSIYKKVKVGSAYVKNMLKRKAPDMSNQEAIKAYIASQAQTRGAKMQKAMEVREQLGGDITKLDPRAPLDRAMARKTGRGGNRPSRGLLS